MRTSLLLIVFILTVNSSFADIGQNIENYLQDFKTLKATFLQYNPDGTVSSGLLYVSKPKYAKLDYNSPDNFIINFTGPFITYYDKETGEAISLPRKNNLADVIRGSYKDTNHITYYENNKAYFEISEEGAKILLRFSVAPLELEGLEVLQDDNKTQVFFSHVDYNIPINNKIFNSFD